MIKQYAHWLHTRWPAGTVEKLPEVRDDGSTSVAGLYVVGDLSGIPLLKFSADSGAKAVQRIAASRPRAADGGLDLAIIGGGVSGFAAALEARKLGLSFELLEAAEPFATIVNFPRAKPIYTYPTEMTPAGDMRFDADVKEALLDELRAQTLAAGITPKIGKASRVVPRGGALEVEVDDQPALRARSVIVAIGRSGNYRKLNVAGEELDKVSNRLHDPRDYADKNVLVVGGGDSALETAIALAESGAAVTLSYRKAEFSRPKPENVQKLDRLKASASPAARGMIDLKLPSSVKRIGPKDVTLSVGGSERTIPNDAVFTMIGREAPLDFFRKSGVNVRGEWRARTWITFVLFVAFCLFVYHWKKTGLGGFEHLPVLRQLASVGDRFSAGHWFPYNVPSLFGAPETLPPLLRTLRVSMGEPGFYYSLVYCVVIAAFGLRRIRRRKTPYVTLQTTVLALVQIVPLFLLPYIILPWLGYHGVFGHGAPRWLADQLFPVAGYGHGREYWRSFGLVLAWPLFFWNVFTDQPMWLWLVISLVQTFVIIPGIVYVWGKGAYCGWICSCGALAETLGDAHRQKMPHGPFWNRLNMAGQVILGFAFVLLGFRVLGWMHVPVAGRVFNALLHDLPLVNYVWSVDLMLAGVIGVGLYFHFSGRVWCRFFCPLAALMHIYARFSRFRILADKKKCISCNVCTSVCHQGIDVMSFANKGQAMADPECVRCSACVQSCPTGVLTFGQVDPKTGAVLKKDRLQASPVQMVELKVNGKRLGSGAMAAH